MKHLIFLLSIVCFNAFAMEDSKDLRKAVLNINTRILAKKNGNQFPTELHNIIEKKCFEIEVDISDNKRQKNSGYTLVEKDGPDNFQLSYDTHTIITNLVGIVYYFKLLNYFEINLEHASNNKNETTMLYWLFKAIDANKPEIMEASLEEKGYLIQVIKMMELTPNEENALLLCLKGAGCT